MNVFSHFTAVVKEAVKAAQLAGKVPVNLSLEQVTVEPPRDPSHGDVATNAALVLAGQAKSPPRDIAESIAAILREQADIQQVEIAGPGFINMRLADRFWFARIPDILQQGHRVGHSNMGKGAKVNVEYVSANPTGPMHVGHVRGAVVGDALASLLEAVGYDVTREYYINDAGSQIDTLARSVHLRYREALGEDIGDIPDGLYPGEYLKPVARVFADRYGDRFLNAGRSEWLPQMRDFATAQMMDLIRRDLSALGIEHEVFFSEKSLHESGLIDEAIRSLEEKGLIYVGVLEPPKGKKPEGWEPRPQTLFRATDFGDDVDRPLKKSDASYTYFAADIAYHYDKIKRGARILIDILGADHGGYAKRIAAAVRAMSDNQASLDVKLCQLVKLYRAGTPLKMSKRSGTFITLREVVDEVGRDVVRFIMLTRRNDAPLDFDFEKVKEQSRDNPVFYVQYAHARIHSALRKAVALHDGLDTSVQALADAPLEKLGEDAELGLIRTMAAWPRVLEGAAEAHEPHRIAFYLYDLASEFHAAWNLGNDDPSKRFVVETDRELTRARLALIAAVAAVIAAGLKILGVEPVTEMH